ncbi:hypothetical protein Ssi03_16260 [Sphaerisporangium siamense]|uniref:Putative membrane protein n=1 Tax=Sphaerisporangium siamense TaxID=795645 RepID=A0A7W7GD38_9ACTN|nr:hypothetical protein [Sphaerisporangium siamense]MBB4702611.1 putative membrane protein [Sphaerisporangium siamense]GII83636.1 hypothetical protein Ssi03_16260 [Sphaerisporangium siamense]
MDETRWWPAIGLVFGTALGFAAIVGGWAAFVIVLVLGVAGYVVGRALSGDLEVSGLRGRRRT